MLWLFAPENRICHFLTTWPMSREWDILDLENIPVAPGVVWFGQLVALAELRRSLPTQAVLLPVNQPEHHDELAVVLVGDRSTYYRRRRCTCFRIARCDLACFPQYACWRRRVAVGFPLYPPAT